MSVMGPVSSVRKSFAHRFSYVSDNGWSVVSTSQVADWLLGEGDLPERSAVLHFDNGWSDTIEVAFPILEGLGMTGTCFPITDGIEATSAGGTAAVRTLTEGVVSKPFMTWDQLQQLLDAGWEIGGHTATHCKKLPTNTKPTATPASSRKSGYPASSSNGISIIVRFISPTPAARATMRPIASWPSSTGRCGCGTWKIQSNGALPIAAPLWQAIDCQNIDLKVPFPEFTRIFEEAGVP